jgi:nucleoid-associated protein YgaU
MRADRGDSRAFYDRLTATKSMEAPVKHLTTKAWTTAALLLCAAMAAATTGCSGKDGANAQMASNPGVTDISVAPAPIAVEPAPQPVAPQPVVSDVPTQAPVAPAAAAGGKYTVQKGDTLWKIAATNYGDGKQWQRIASANPGLTPSSLKAGQTIMIP